MFLLAGAQIAGAQTNSQQLLPTPGTDSGVTIDLSVGDTSFLHNLLTGKFFHSPFFETKRQKLFESMIDSLENADSTADSLIFELRVGKMFRNFKKGSHSFIITEDPYDRLVPFGENRPFIDFNRVNGFVLGIATPGYVNFGRHDELGIKGGIAYGFEEEKGQSMLGGEYRIPIGSFSDTIAVERWRWLPTIAIGAEYHNITTTEDTWRAGRIENAFYAFFAREDFRDYFKVDGWNADVAFRLNRNSELRLEYRSDIYYDQPQRVFRGRWGGNKVLPVNPPITTGRLNSWVVTAGTERVGTDVEKVSNIFGDKVTIEAQKGRAYILQAEFGTNTGIDKNFARYILEARNFTPIVAGLSFDTRLRFESSTGDVPIQKLSYLGGPSSLQAFKNKVFVGNRMLLLNTEIRFGLDMLSSFFDGGDPEIIIINDLGYLNMADSSAGALSGFGELKPSTIIYNVGVGIGNASGGQLGVMFRTDKKETGRFFFRFQRPF